jgi:hypothetical protein
LYFHRHAGLLVGRWLPDRMGASVEIYPSTRGVCVRLSAGLGETRRRQHCGLEVFWCMSSSLGYRLLSLLLLPLSSVVSSPAFLLSHSDTGLLRSSSEAIGQSLIKCLPRYLCWSDAIFAWSSNWLRCTNWDARGSVKDFGAGSQTPSWISSKEGSRC